MIVGTSELAELFRVSTRWIQKLNKEGILSQVERGKYDLAETIAQYIDYVKMTHEVDGEKIDYNKEKALHERAKRKLAEIELDHLEGKMHKAEDVEKVMTQMLGNFRSRVLAIPTKAAPRVQGLTELAIIQEIIRKEVYEALTELSNYDPEMFLSEEDKKSLAKEKEQDSESKKSSKNGGKKHGNSTTKADPKRRSKNQ